MSCTHSCFKKNKVNFFDTPLLLTQYVFHVIDLQKQKFENALHIAHNGAGASSAEFLCPASASFHVSSTLEPRTLPSKVACSTPNYVVRNFMHGRESICSIPQYPKKSTTNPPTVVRNFMHGRESICSIPQYQKKSTRNPSTAAAMHVSCLIIYNCSIVLARPNDNTFSCMHRSYCDSELVNQYDSSLVFH